LAAMLLRAGPTRSRLKPLLQKSCAAPTGRSGSRPYSKGAGQCDGMGRGRYTDSFSLTRARVGAAHEAQAPTAGLPIASSLGPALVDARAPCPAPTRDRGALRSPSLCG